MATATEARSTTDAPVLEQIECMCGEVMLDGKCLNVECETAATQALPKQAIHGSVITQPYAFTIRGSVD